MAVMAVAVQNSTWAVLYTDGSGLASGGPAGVGYTGLVNGELAEGSCSLPSATNQQAEILAAAFALDAVPPCHSILLYSDSQYVVHGWDWLPGWIERGWRTKSGVVANQRHWKRLQQAVARHGEIEFRWVRGHDGTEGNERADELARAARLAAPDAAPSLAVATEDP